MSKRRVEDILYDQSFKNKKCDKIKIKLGIDQKHVSLLHLDDLSNYNLSRFARKIIYLKSICVP